LSGVVCAADVDSIVEHIQKEYSTIRDIKGRFSQRSYLKDIEKTEDYSGAFYIKKPSRIRWRYSDPRDEEVIISERKLWIYKRSEKQVLRGVFDEGSYSQLPIALLQSMSSLKKDFYIRLIRSNTLELIPRHRMGAIKRIELMTVLEGFPIKEFTITDLYDNRVTIRVDEVDINTGLKDSFFSLEIPPDVEVFDLSN